MQIPFFWEILAFPSPFFWIQHSKMRILQQQNRNPAVDAWLDRMRVKRGRSSVMSGSCGLWCCLVTTTIRLKTQKTNLHTSFSAPGRKMSPESHWRHRCLTTDGKEGTFYAFILHFCGKNAWLLIHRCSSGAQFEASRAKRERGGGEKPKTTQNIHGVWNKYSVNDKTICAKGDKVCLYCAYKDCECPGRTQRAFERVLFMCCKITEACWDCKI